MTFPTDPFRFDDRTGHYGSGQADLAPVSPLAALPREGSDARPLDPMGASPADGRITDEGPTSQHSTDRTETRMDVRSDMHSSNTSQSGTVSAQSGSGVTTQTAAITEPREAPVLEEAAPTQTVLLRSQADMRVEGEVRSDAPTTPAMSSGTPVSLLLEAGPGALAGPPGFADIAARMDQMMAEMTVRMDALSPRLTADEEDDEAGPDLVADAQDRLDDLFDSLGDRLGGTTADTGDESSLETARDRLDGWAGGLGPRDAAAAEAGPDPLSGAAARLDDLRAGLGRDDGTDPDAPAPLLADASLLARLFDGDAAPDDPPAGETRLAEFLDEMEVPFTLPLPGFDPGRWDDFPDVG